MGGRAAARGAARGGAPAARGRGGAAASGGMAAPQAFGAGGYDYVRSLSSVCINVSLVGVSDELYVTLADLTTTSTCLTALYPCQLR